MNPSTDPHGLRLGTLANWAAAPPWCRRRRLAQPLTPGCQWLELDLTQTRQLDSRALALLLDLHCRAQARPHPVRVRLVGLQPPVRLLLEVTRLAQFFDLPAPPTGLPEQPPRGDPS